MSQQIKKFNRDCGNFELSLIASLLIYSISSLVTMDKPLPTFIDVVLQCIQLIVFTLVSRKIEYRKS